MGRLGPLRPALCMLLSLCLSGIAYGQSIDAEIARVETSLLPYHAIEGEPPYTLAERMEHYHVPGVTIAVIEDYGIRWIASYGVADAETAEPVNETTMFCVGSVSKAVTAAGALALVADGLIDLDVDVNAQLRGWRFPENEFTRQAPVTPRGLLNHSGGAVFSPPHNYLADRFPTALQILTGEDPATSNPVVVDVVPGTRFQYSNGGFTAMQLLIEEKSGQPFAEFISERVFTPLGMMHSTFAAPLSPEHLPFAAHGHQRDGTRFPGPTQWLGHVAAGGLYTTAADYAAFVIELQQSLRGHGGKVLPRELVTQMVSPHASSRYGLGVFLREERGESYFSHIGDARGFIAGFTAHRTDGHGAVILTNGAGSINLVREIFRGIGTVYDWPGYRSIPRRALALNDDARSNLTGRYRIGCDEIVTIADDGEHLRIESGRWPGFRLYAVATDTLVCRERDGAIVVRPGAGHGASAETLFVGLSDEIGRLPADPSVVPRMTAGERTPLEMLLAGDFDGAHAAYGARRDADPADPEIAERRFNILGYRLLGADRVADAVAVFRLNTRLYPTSANAHDSLGEGLAAAGDTAAAVASYRKSLELNPENTNGRDMLQKLTGGR